MSRFHLAFALATALVLSAAVTSAARGAEGFVAEGLPILAAYAAFQDWDGLFAYTFAHDDLLALKPYMKGHFDHAMDPVKVPQIAAGALLFLRGDVRSALETAERTYTREQVLESLRLPGAEHPLFTPGMPRSLPFRHHVRVRSFDGTGRPMGAPVPAAKDGDAWSLPLGKPATTWGVVRVQR